MFSRCPRKRSHGPAIEIWSVVHLPDALISSRKSVKSFPSHAAKGSSRCRRFEPAAIANGPYPPYTDELLKILEQRQVKATFFMVAENAEKHPELVAKIAAQGHEIALHALKHRDFLKLSLAEQQKDIAAGKRILEKLSGQKITLMRPPHGFRDWAVIDTLQKNGLTAVNWSVIPRDWTNPGVSVIVDRIMEQMHPGAIILLHDGDSPKYVASREETIQAVSVIIDKLCAEGYNFVTVNELMQKGE